MNKGCFLLHIDIGGSYVKIGILDSFLGACSYKVVLTMETPQRLDDVCDLVINYIELKLPSEVRSLRKTHCLIGVPGVPASSSLGHEEWMIPHLGKHLNLSPLRKFLLGKVIALTVVNDALALLKIATLEPFAAGNHLLLSFGTSLGCAFKRGCSERSLELAHSPLLLHGSVSVDQYANRYGVIPKSSQRIKCLDLYNGNVLCDLIRKSLESRSELDIQDYFYSLFHMIDVVLASEAVQGNYLVHLYGSVFSGFSRLEMECLLSGLALQSLIENQYSLASINFNRLAAGGY